MSAKARALASAAACCLAISGGSLEPVKSSANCAVVVGSVLAVAPFVLAASALASMSRSCSAIADTRVLSPAIRAICKAAISCPRVLPVWGFNFSSVNFWSTVSPVPNKSSWSVRPLFISACFSICWTSSWF